MKRKKFESLLGMAKAFQGIDHRTDFWRGFQRGVRHLYHGENFGTPEEHEQWMNCANGEYRKQMQTGYRAGYHYDDLKIGDPEDIQPLRKILGWSVADVAEIAAVSPRTVEGWEQGRQISDSALTLIQKYLMI